jgi:hypothetical protein
MANDQFKTNLDFSTDDVSESEAAALLDWYSTTHGDGQPNLTSFIPFWLDHRPAVAKRFRKFAEDVAGMDGALPAGAIALLCLHSYVIISYGKGVLYEVIAGREWGVGLDAILDEMALAFLHSGPFGMTTAADWANDAVAKWRADGSADIPAMAWPDGWSFDTAILRANLDYSNPTFTDAEKDTLLAWYLDMHGEIPPHIPFMMRHAPAALKGFRYRFEDCLTGALPVQMIPLSILHTAVLKSNVEAVRRAVYMSWRLGVGRQLVEHAIGCGYVYSGEMGTDAVARAAGEQLDSLPFT